MTGSRTLRRVVLGLICALVLNATALVALASTNVAIAGYEVFPGVRFGGTTYGASFAGTAAPSGSWAASVNYIGTPGLGGDGVAIVGGSYTYKVGAAPRSTGRVTGGAVMWPASLSGDIGCGAGVATFTATLSNGGSIAGCLDDTHLATVFPPTIVGILTAP